MMDRHLFFLWIILMPAGLLHAQSPEDTWNSARDAYLSGNIERATTQFGTYLAQVPNSAAAMYNLANCYLQQGDLGHAILFYERALKLRPHDPDIHHNLSIANSRRVNPVVEIREFFVRRWLWAVAGIMRPSAWGAISVILFWCCAVALAIRIRTGHWRIPQWVMSGCALGFLFALLMGLQRNYDILRTDRAIVMKDETVVTLAPDPESKRVANIGAGEKVLIMDSLDTYFKVRLPNFEHGWLPMKSVEKI